MNDTGMVKSFVRSIPRQNQTTAKLAKYERHQRDSEVFVGSCRVTQQECNSFEYLVEGWAMWVSNELIVYFGIIFLCMQSHSIIKCIYSCLVVLFKACSHFFFFMKADSSAKATIHILSHSKNLPAGRVRVWNRHSKTGHKSDRPHILISSR